MKKLLRRIPKTVYAGPIYWVVRLIGTTLRLHTEGYAKAKSLGGPKIYASWHGRTLLGAILFRGEGVATIISTSRDGEMQDRIFQKFGFQTIRGSSSRGGVKVLVDCIKVLKTGATMAFTPDGPRGPSGIVQEGIMAMAQKSGAAIIPVGVSAQRRWLAKSWDRYMIPKPFSRALMIFGEPIRVAPDVSRAELERLRLELEQEIHRLEREAERRMGHE